MRNWIRKELSTQGFDPHNYGLCTPCEHDDRNHGPTGKKVLVIRNGGEHLDPNRFTWIGGICSLFTADSDQIRKKKLTFKTEESFREWIMSWYPRVDQVHDCVGIPPRSCKRVVYIVEDSIWAKRVAKWTGLNGEKIAQIFQEVHQTQGAPVIQRWLHNYGFRGQVDVVYSSSVERELELALRIWERQTGKNIRPADRDFAKVELMYTPLWLDILGIDRGCICEPIHHMDVPPHLSGFAKVFDRSHLYQMGFLPFWCSAGPTRLLPLDEVTNHSNWKNFQADDWSRVNFAFTTPDPFGFSLSELTERILHDLTFIYGG